MPIPTRHYWGIPMDYNPGSFSCWSSNRELPPEHTDAGRFDGYIDAAFARGLCWELDIPSARRVGFPSWSWAGWMGPLAESAWGSVSQTQDPEAKIWLETTNRTCVRLNESIIIELNRPGSIYAGYNPTLRIEAWAVEVGLKNVADVLPDIKSAWHRNPDPRYFVAVQRTEENTSLASQGMRYWTVILSVSVQEGDELHSLLCRERFYCALLGKGSHFLLVVRKITDVTERIGHMSLFSRCVESDALLETASPKPRRPRYHQPKSLFDFIAPRRGTILLG